MSLTVKLDIYEGPLDLLLHLIRKNEVDIYDIPIAPITAQYLEYLDLMEAMNIDVAGEFLLMAATLLQIKSRMLLPELEPETEEEEEDPRMAIVRPLLEHLRLKEAADVLERRTLLNRDVFTRPGGFEEVDPRPDPEEYIEANLFDLVDAFRQLVRQEKGPTGIKIMVETKTIKERIREIMDILAKVRSIVFTDLCLAESTKAEFVLSFLSILELARVGYLKIYQHVATGAVTLFYVERPNRRAGYRINGSADEDGGLTHEL